MRTGSEVMAATVARFFEESADTLFAVHAPLRPRSLFAVLARHRLSPRGHVRRERDELRPLLGGRRARRALPLRRGRHRDPGRPDRRRRPRLARLPAADPAGSALRVPRARRRTTRRPGCAATRARSCSTRTRRRRSATTTGTSPCSRTRSATRTPSTTTTPPAHVMLSVVVTPFFDWGGDRPAEDPVQRDADLRGAREGAHRAPPGRAGGGARHLRGPREPACGRAPPEARR